jgi:hypothetical protein
MLREDGGMQDQRLDRQDAVQVAHRADLWPPYDAFARVEGQASRIRAAAAAGHLSQEQLEWRLADLVVKDRRGRWWLVGGQPGEWYRHDGVRWVRDRPVDRLGSAPVSWPLAPRADPRPAASAPVAGPAPRSRRFPGLGVPLWSLIFSLVTVVSVAGALSGLWPWEALLGGGLILVIGLSSTVHRTRHSRQHS